MAVRTYGLVLLGLFRISRGRSREEEKKLPYNDL